MDLAKLNTQFGIANRITFKAYQHTTIAEITSTHSKATISLYGAQVLSFIPKGDADMLFMSSKSYFQEGKAIRGGIPVCWPWFGAHPVDNSLPSHGFARISTWEVINTTEEEDEVVITLSLASNANTLKLWPYQFEAQLELRVGQDLSVALKTINTDDKAFEISSALHSYFNITDINTIKLEGLANTAYLDDVKEEEGQQKEEQLSITERIDRRYRNTTNTCSIHDANRTIKVAKEGSQITVVWNPGAELTKQMADLGDNDYLNMLCVEAANSLEDTITVRPGRQHILKTIISSCKA